MNTHPRPAAGGCSSRTSACTTRACWVIVCWVLRARTGLNRVRGRGRTVLGGTQSGETTRSESSKAVIVPFFFLFFLGPWLRSSLAGRASIGTFGKF